jgi:hypothetical protein
LLLQPDADRLIAQAAASAVLPSDPNNPVAKAVCANAEQDDDGDDSGGDDDD